MAQRVPVWSRRRRWAAVGALVALGVAPALTRPEPDLETVILQRLAKIAPGPRPSHAIPALPGAVADHVPAGLAELVRVAKSKAPWGTLLGVDDWGTGLRADHHSTIRATLRATRAERAELSPLLRQPGVLRLLADLGRLTIEDANADGDTQKALELCLDTLALWRDAAQNSDWLASTLFESTIDAVCALSTVPRPPARPRSSGPSA